MNELVSQTEQMRSPEILIDGNQSKHKPQVFHAIKNALHMQCTEYILLCRRRSKNMGIFDNSASGIMPEFDFE